MNRFETKVALVTGGRAGIGHAIARRLQSEGATVITAQRGTDTAFDSISADFCDSNAPARIIDEVIARYGQLDVLVNSAGMMQEAPIEQTTFEAWQRNIALNLSAPFLLIRAALPYLRSTHGNIVNVGSLEGLAANPNHAAYCATKAGLHGLTRAVAVDHGHENIRCNAVAPGWIDTDLNAQLVANAVDADAFQRDLARIHPLRRAGRPEEVAALVAFLASDDAAFVSGEIYRVDGGRSAQLSAP
ncbi:oxidoreductase [Salinisphaera sp. S4-8]|uniref:SDR family NAD(P)-dependent oxidoreductase n=1 Tax=Salinisphaera sp. S4-8 TaxID=633357 RepID=UPI0033420DCF